MSYHAGKDLRAVVYGGDFTILGSEHNSDWFKNESKSFYEFDVNARLGLDEGDTEVVVRLLNRIIEWKHDALTWMRIHGMQI